MEMVTFTPSKFIYFKTIQYLSIDIGYVYVIISTLFNRIMSQLSRNPKEY